MEHQTMLVISALLLGAPFACYYAVRKLRSRVLAVTFEEARSGVKCVYLKIRDDRLVDMVLEYEDGSVDRVVDRPGKTEEDAGGSE